MVDVLRQFSLDLLIGAIRHPNNTTRRQLAEAFWDLQYLYRFGITKLPSSESLGPSSLRAPSDPKSLDHLRIHEELVLGLLDVVDGDPDPEQHLQVVLSDRTIRLAAAKALSQRLTSGLESLNNEITRLEGRDHDGNRPLGTGRASGGDPRVKRGVGVVQPVPAGRRL